MHWDWASFGIGCAIGIGGALIISIGGLFMFARGMSDNTSAAHVDTED